MRRTAYVLFGVLVVVACRSAPQSAPEISNVVPPPIEVKVEIDAAMRDKLSLGLPIALEMTVAGVPVGRCTVSFDLWDENYRVRFSKTQIETHADQGSALKSCVDTRELQRVGNRNAKIVVAEAQPEEPLYKPAAYPTF